MEQYKAHIKLNIEAINQYLKDLVDRYGRDVIKISFKEALTFNFKWYEIIYE